MTTEEKFNAAVNIIRNLPKHGPFQPSNGTMLKFYAYYKQAKEGPNVSSKPSFWDVISKAKWDAWRKLGNMPRETAMNKYVEEFKKIAEKLSRTHSLDEIADNEVNLYANVPVEDLQLLIGPSVVEKVCSRPGSPFSISPLTSRETSPHRNQVVNGTSSTDEEYQKTTNKGNNRYDALVKGTIDETSVRVNKQDDGEDSFLDTLENSNVPTKRFNDRMTKINNDYVSPMEEFYYRNEDDLLKSAEDKISRCSNTNTFYESCDDTNAAILRTLLKLNEDVEKVFEKLISMEEHLSNISKQMRPLVPKYSHEHKRDYYLRCSPNVLLFFLFFWPVVTQFIQFWFLRKRRFNSA